MRSPCLSVAPPIDLVATHDYRKEKLMGRATLQRQLCFEDEGPWEQLPKTTRDLCQQLLSQLLQEILEAERKEGRDE